MLYTTCDMARKIKNELPPIAAEYTNVGQKIATVRKQQGLTQGQLAERIGVNRTLVTDYEIGRIKMSAEMLCRFAIALNISTDKLLGLKSSELDYSKDLKLTRRIRKIAQLPPAQKKSLLNTIDAYLTAHAANNGESFNEK